MQNNYYSMKKIFVCLILFTSINSIYPQANKTSWGIKAEYTISDFIIKDIKESDSNPKFGFTAGGFIMADITRYFSLQGEILFQNKQSRITCYDIKGEYNYWGVEIPIYAMFRKELKNNVRLYCGIGPYTNFGFSAELKNSKEKQDLYKDSKMVETNSGFGLLIGYEFPCGIQLNAN